MFMFAQKSCTGERSSLFRFRSPLLLATIGASQGIPLLDIMPGAPAVQHAGIQKKLVDREFLGEKQAMLGEIGPDPGGRGVCQAGQGDMRGKLAVFGLKTGADQDRFDPVVQAEPLDAQIPSALSSKSIPSPSM